MTTMEIPKSQRRVPCCLAISSTAMPLHPGDQTLTRQWRALSVADRAELGCGSFETNPDDPLAIVRDKAMEHVRSQGYEPQQYVLENPPID